MSSRADERRHDDAIRLERRDVGIGILARVVVPA
jgi:hypothetical protein